MGWQKLTRRAGRAQGDSSFLSCATLIRRLKTTPAKLEFCQMIFAA
jgi:hypothetical protein